MLAHQCQNAQGKTNRTAKRNTVGDRLTLEIQIQQQKASTDKGKLNTITNQLDSYGPQQDAPSPQVHICSIHHDEHHSGP